MHISLETIVVLLNQETVREMVPEKNSPEEEIRMHHPV